MNQNVVDIFSTFGFSAAMIAMLVYIAYKGGNYLIQFITDRVKFLEDALVKTALMEQKIEECLDRLITAEEQVLSALVENLRTITDIITDLTSKKTK